MLVQQSLDELSQILLLLQSGVELIELDCISQKHKHFHPKHGLADHLNALLKQVVSLFHYQKQIENLSSMREDRLSTEDRHHQTLQCGSLENPMDNSLLFEPLHKLREYFNHFSLESNVLALNQQTGQFNEKHAVLVLQKIHVEVDIEHKVNQHLHSRPLELRFSRNDLVDNLGLLRERKISGHFYP